mgnify:CR=1 FL=1
MCALPTQKSSCDGLAEATTSRSSVCSTSVRVPFTASMTFLSNAAASTDVHKKLGLQKQIATVKKCRGIGKRDLKLNDALPHIEVDPETYVVKADGVVLKCDPMAVLPMAQRYFLF